jgi:undecaprenyl-diphosphatase
LQIGLSRVESVLAAIAKSLRRLEEEDLSSLVAILIVVLGVWAFLDLAYAVDSGATLSLDEKVIRSLRTPQDLNVPIGPVWLREVGRDITALGGYAFLILLVTLVAGFLKLDGKRGAMWFLLGAVISGYLVSLGLKTIYDRPRPTIVPHLAAAFQSSFPSGHSMMSAVVYLTLGALLSRFAANLPRMRVYFVIVALVLTGLVGISRVYLGVHYPTDVLAGWTAGLVWATLCSFVARKLQRRGMVESEL